MTAEPEPWASALSLEPDKAAAFERVAGALKTTPADLLRRMAEHLIDLDRDRKADGRSWTELSDDTAEHIIAEAIGESGSTQYSE